MLVGLKVPAIKQFPFETAPKAFHGGVIVAIALAAHGSEETGDAPWAGETSEGKWRRVVTAAILG